MTVSRSRRVALILGGSVLVALVARTYYVYRREMDAARAPVSSGSQIANTPCGSLEYADVGKGPPVLVIHGAGGGFDQGLQLAQPLIANGFRVIAVSRFGYLRTSLPRDASPLAQADAHACVLDALKVGRVAVIGGSAGAASAMQLCLRHPERCSALVLLFPIAFAPGRTQSKPPALYMRVIKSTLHSDFLYWVATKVARDTLFKTILATPPEDFRNTSEEEQARALQVMRHILPISEREKGIWNDATISPSLPPYDLEQIRVPTLLMSAEDDLYGTFQNARYTAEHIPGARFVGFRTGGHLLLGHWAEAWAQVVRFLASQPSDQQPIPARLGDGGSVAAVTDSSRQRALVRAGQILGDLGVEGGSLQLPNAGTSAKYFVQLLIHLR